MTSATSAPLASNPRRPAFTLVELLVVIGIIVLLIGILLPVMSRAMRSANRARIASDLNAISTALEAYKSDNLDYPRIIYGTGTQYNGIGSGAAVLGKALMALGDSTTAPYASGNTYLAGQIVSNSGSDYQALQPVPAGSAPSEGSPYWAPIPLASAADGADGAGFRIRAGSAGGRVYGPYLQPDKFKTRGLAILDLYGNPILYYPGNPSKPVINADATTNGGKFGAGNAYVGTAQGATPGGTAAPTAPCQSFYNYSDNDTVALNAGNGNSTTDFTPAFSGINVMEAMLGDYSMQGYIAPGETAAATSAYILWSAGPDGAYGPLNLQTDPTTVRNQVTNCDDVTFPTLAR